MSSWEEAGKSDEWYTPAYVFDALGVTFDLDVAAPIDGPRHVPCRAWISAESIQRKWNGFVWMNPPYGPRNGLVPWLDRFIEHGNGIALVPDRTSAPWFQSSAAHMDAILFVSPKIKFERPDGSTGNSPGTGSALMGIGQTAMGALLRARSLGFMARIMR